MADLLRVRANTSGDWHPDGLVSLYCWPCRMVHELALTDVEKIVYALGADAAEGWSSEHAIDDGPACLLQVLQMANSPDAYLEHVEQGVECREKTPAPEVAYVRPPLAAGEALDAERRGIIAEGPGQFGSRYIAAAEHRGEIR